MISNEVFVVFKMLLENIFRVSRPWYQNSIQEEIKCRLKAGNSCYYLVQIPLACIPPLMQETMLHNHVAQLAILLFYKF